MIVGIGDQRVETHPLEQFCGVLFGLGTDTAQFFDQKQIGPFIPGPWRIVCLEQGKGAHHPRTPVACVCFLPVESFYQQDVTVADCDDPVSGRSESARARKREHGMLDPCAIPPVIAAIESGDPEPIASSTTALGRAPPV